MIDHLTDEQVEALANHAFLINSVGELEAWAPSLTPHLDEDEATGVLVVLAREVQQARARRRENCKCLSKESA